MHTKPFPRGLRVLGFFLAWLGCGMTIILSSMASEGFHGMRFSNTWYVILVPAFIGLYGLAMLFGRVHRGTSGSKREKR